MSLVLDDTIKHVNAEFAKIGAGREYSYNQKGVSYTAKVRAFDCDAIIGEGYTAVADAVADIYLNAFEAMSLHAVALKSQTTNPLPRLAVYETISDLVDVAVDGVEARERDADGLDDRLNVQAGQYAVERGRVIIDQFSDAYRGGDLK